MAGARFAIDVDDDLVTRAFDGLIRELGDPADILDEIGSYLVTATDLRFEAERDASGTPWKPSERAKATGGKTLQLSGRLRRSITHRVTGGTVEVGTNVIYAAPHQFGWPEKNLVQRSFLGVDDRDRTAILRIAEDALEEATRP